MVQEAKMIPRILRDVTDGVLVLDKQGTILFLNPRGEQILGFGEAAVGRKYAAVMLEKNQKGNDHFHQFLLDSMYDSENTHKGEIDYIQQDGTQLKLNMTTSFLFDETGTVYEGVVIQFADVTEIAKLRKKQQESSFVFVICIVYVCGWAFAYVLWEVFGRPIPTKIMTQIVQFIGVPIFYFLLKKTSFTIQDMGLGFQNIKPILKTDAIIAAVGLALMIAIKGIVVLVAPDVFGADAPFFNFKFTWSEWIYPFTVVLQEFLTRSVMHENLRRVIVAKNSEWLAIGVSSLMFGVLHLHLGILFMVGAVILLGALGMLYRKQGTIWGLCIPHYVLGIALTVLF